MTTGAFRAIRDSALVVFEGQSLNLRSAMLFGVDPWPDRMMRGRGITWANVSISGASLTDLANGTGTAAGQPASTRLHPYGALPHTKRILVICGGQTDLNNEADSGAQVHADHVSAADAARAAGFTHVMVTTIPGSTTYDAGEETARNDCNALLAADTAGDFDEVVDLTATALDTHSSTYFWDSIHLSATGAQLLADTAAPHLDTILAS